METRVLALTVGILACLGIIAVDLTYIQAVEGPELAKDPRNARMLYATYARWRAPIISADGEVLAESVPSGDDLRYVRKYPKGPLFGHITGFLSFYRGATELERTYGPAMLGDDLSLATKPRALRGRLMGEKPNATVVLSISSKYQLAAAQALGTKKGAVVAINPRTGAVLAMYSNPTFDPNPIASHDRAVADEAYRNATDPAAGKPMLSRAFAERRPPGSTFKVVVAAAALEAGISPATSFPDPPLLDLPGTDRKLANFQRNKPCATGGAITLHRALVVSCNTTFGQLGLSLGDEPMRKQASEFGFGQDWDVVGLDTAASLFPPDSAFQGNEAAKAYAAIGQFDVQATPLQMALVAAAVANGGNVLEPYVVDKILSQKGEVLEDRGASGGRLVRRAMSAANAAILRDMMVDAVEDGTGKNARIARVKVAGKTGTTSDFEQAWFIGFAPADDPRVAVAVLVENEGREATGGEVAAPIARRIMQEILGTQPA